MKVIFAGTPEFAARALEAILAAGFQVPLVLTQPDRPAGRGQKLQLSAVKQAALSHNIPVYQPERLRDPASHESIRAAGGDIMVVAAYGLILPQAVLDIPPQGCINIHASLLPRWRGAAPIQRAIEAGDEQSGVAIMRMEAGLDTGPVLLMEALPIAATDTAASLHDKLARQGARLIVDALNRLATLSPTPQVEAGVTYAHKIEKAEGRIDWQGSATELGRRIRAFNPFPGAVTQFGDTPIKIWNAVAVTGQGAAGTLLKAEGASLVVACGQDALALTELQKPGGKRLTTADFLRSFPLAAGDRFEG